MDRHEKQNLENKARKGAEHVTEEARKRGDSLKVEASEQANRTASALDSAADQFDAEGQHSLADALAKLSHNLGDFASTLEHKSIDDLMHDATRMARRNPMLFVAGSVGAGMLLSRFFRAQDGAIGRDAYSSGESSDELRPEYRPDFDEATATAGTNADPIGAAPGGVPADEAPTSDPLAGAGTMQPQHTASEHASSGAQKPGATQKPGGAQKKDPASRSKGGK